MTQTAEAYEWEETPEGLDPEQAYVFEIAAAQGIDARVVEHDEPTETCEEKAALLGWPVQQVVKAVYFRRKKSRVGIVMPDTGEIPKVEILTAVLGIAPEVAERYTTQQYTPTGMDRGTCTPFPLESIVGKGREISHLVVVDCPEVHDTPVDISVGGGAYDGQLRSMHLPYRGIHSILLERFGPEVVHLYRQEER